MNECAEVPGQAEMREIIDIASEKGMRYLSGQASRAGYAPLTPEDLEATSCQVVYEDRLGQGSRVESAR